MKVMLTGGTGVLGKELLKNNPDILAPTHEDMDILDQQSCVRHILLYGPRVLIHAAAFTSVPAAEESALEAREVNVRGTLNLINVCESQNVKLVYISTDYVFDGRVGDYGTGEAINPINKYAMTKAAAELAVKTMPNSLIIRTSFCQNEFPYPKAFHDQFSSKDYVDVIAPLVYEKAISDKTGIVHVGTPRKSVYDLAKRRKPDVGKLSISEVEFFPPADTSLKL
jgi:dTDP-4-dehydrorhamnose reductase